MSAESIQQSQIDFANTALAGASSFTSALNALLAIDPNSFLPTDLDDPNYANSDIASDPVATANFLLQYKPLPFLPILPGAVQPTAPAAANITVNTVSVPSFDSAAPVLDIPATPSNAIPVPPSSPSISEPGLPTAPNIVIPAPPAVGSIALPDPPSIQIPTFNSTLPVDDLVVPTNSFSFSEAQYDSANLSELEEKLLDAMRNGGYGIEPADEAALWQRGRDRETEILTRNIGSVLTQAATRGFPILPGTALVLVQREEDAFTEKLSSLSREIMLKRGELYVDNRKFTFQEVRQLESILINYYAGRMERALNAQRYALDFSIQLFNALVGRYNARIIAYQAEANVFAKRLEAALAQVQIYKTLIEGKKVEADIQRTLVEAYRATLAGIETTVNIYRTQMEAAKVQTDIQRLKIETFKSQVDAFAEQVRAKTAEFGLYESQIRGQVARVQAYQAEAQAYAARVQGVQAQANIEATRVDALVKTANLQIERYRADIQRYLGDLQSQNTTSQILTSYFSAQTSQYRADVDALVASFNLAQTTYNNNRETQIKNANIARDNAELIFRGLKEAYDVKRDAGRQSADYYSKLIAGATSALQSIGAIFVQQT